MFSLIGKTLDTVIWVFIIIPAVVIMATPYVLYTKGHKECLSRLRNGVWPGIRYKLNQLWMEWRWTFG